MATFFSGEYVDYWSSTANRVYGTLTGDVNRSGDTVYLQNLRLELTPTQTSWGSSPFSFTVNGTTTTQTISAPPTTIGLNDTSFGVSPSQTSASIGWSGPENSGAFTVSFPSRVTAPTGLTASNLVKGTRSFTATVSITGWGGAGDANSRYRELQVWTVPFETQPRRWAIQKGNSLSGNITADNSSNGTLNLMPNTSYSLGVYATNGQISTGNVFWRDATTLPEAATIELVDSDGEGSTFSFTTKLDGGKYDKQIRYSLDGGTTWITAATVSGGAVQTGTFTITGLIAGQTYTLKNRTELANGTYSTGTDVVFTAGSVNRYGSVDGTTRKIVKRYGSVNGQTVSIVKRYGSVNGVTKAI